MNVRSTRMKVVIPWKVDTWWQSWGTTRMELSLEILGEPTGVRVVICTCPGMMFTSTPVSSTFGKMFLPEAAETLNPLRERSAGILEVAHLTKMPFVKEMNAPWLMLLNVAFTRKWRAWTRTAAVLGEPLATVVQTTATVDSNGLGTVASRRCNGASKNICRKNPGDCCVYGSDCHGCPWGNEHVFPNVCGSSRRCKLN